MTKAKLLFVLSALMLCLSAQASEFEWATDFTVGDPFPDSDLISTTGKKTSVASLAGVNGYLIQFNRSVVW